MNPILLFCLLLCSFSSYSQTYWQQHVATKIDVQLDDNNHMLQAYEELVYTNNSPDTLKYIYIHLWANAYKNDYTPFAKQKELNKNSDFYYSKKEDRGYIDSLQFTVNGVSADHYISADAPDIARIDLSYPLLPGKSIKIATPFRVKLPLVFSRSGHTGQAYYVSQWFPKPAVYDKNGWHPISYLDQGEFYSEFGSYDVSISLPTNYILMATGNCETNEENKWLDSLSVAPLPADTLYKNNFPVSDVRFKTVRFTENNVHDFAWFADKRYIVRKDTVVSPGNNKQVITWSAFLPSFQESWKNANKYLKDAVLHYGKWVGPYPYNTIKAVLGDMKSGGGMEYPTITLIDKAGSAKLSTVVIHEAGHNWFYGMLGSNERSHPWLDEGLNTFYEQKTTDAVNQIKKRKKRNALDESLIYYQLANTADDQAINSHSEHFRNINYGVDVYYKSTLMLQWLEEYMGEEEFGVAMKKYFDKWCFRHPQPEDFRTIMEENSTKPIGWFFDGALNTSKKIDYKITKAKRVNDSTVVKVKNKSEIAAPMLLTAYSNDSITGSVWTPPFKGCTKVTLATSYWNRLRVDDVIPDAKSTNNVYRPGALFHHFGLKLKPVIGVNRSDKDKIFILPAFGNNKYDGVMAGITLHNLTIPENRFAFVIAPLFSFNNETLNGVASLGYAWHPTKLFKDIYLTVDAKSFHNNETDKNLNNTLYSRYIKISPSLQFVLQQPDPHSTVTRMLELKEYYISEEIITNGLDSLSQPALNSQQNLYAGIRYLHHNDRTYNPFSYSAEAHANNNFAKLNLIGNIKIDYNKPGKAIYVRGYFGKFFSLNDDPATTQRYWLNATYSGINDYLYDGTYRGRNDNNSLAGQQISTMQEGGFKIPVFNGVYRTDNWMATVNFKTDLPLGKLPFRLFVDAGLIPNPSPGFNNIKSTLTLYDAGVEAYFSNIVSFYFPVLMSNDFRDYLSNTHGNKKVFAKSISFTLHLHNINWLRLPSKLLKSTLK